MRCFRSGRLSRASHSRSKRPLDGLGGALGPSFHDEGSAAPGDAIGGLDRMPCLRFSPGERSTS